ncbi:MAG TPA: glycosyltransferase family 2 protein [Bryobacteraceae bacterium]|nr:glycosyltransferase family 2 protein [Bryobacteraceae bacterium]
MAWATLILWLSLAVPLYAYLGYPIALLFMRVFVNRSVRKEPFEPQVTLLIPAYNEAEHITDKIRNSLALDYPAAKLEVLVACDGSRDGTPQLAQSLADGVRVRVLSFPDNRGKISTLNDGVRESKGEIVVFSDATALLKPDAVRRLMMSFADGTVGAAGGRYMVVRPDDVNIGPSEDFYWKYETFLKTQESDIASTLGAHGHLHAIRRELYPFPAPGTINDDYVIPVSVLGKGYRAVYEPKAVVYEEAREMAGFGRRVRIMAGNLQQLREIKALLRPLRPSALFFFFSHKMIRLAVPFAMVCALAANLWLVSSTFYAMLALLQGLFYGLAILGACVRLRPRFLSLPYYFSMINAAVFFALYQVMSRRHSVAWK